MQVHNSWKGFSLLPLVMNPEGTLDDDGAWTTSHAHPHSHMTAHRHKASSCHSLLIKTQQQQQTHQ